jgi:MFS family permease
MNTPSTLRVGHESETKPSYLKLFTEGRAALSCAVFLAVTMVALDILIVNTVLPSILRELGGISFYAWAIGAYSLANFITIPIFSTLVHKIGGRLSFILSTSAFLIGSIVAATAPRMEWIVAGRFIQGLGAGGFVAIPFSLISLHYPAELQPRAVGLISAVWGAAAVGGPLLGATLLKIGGWPWVFWFNLPVGSVIMGLGLLALRKEKKPHEPKIKLNWFGSMIFAAATALLLELFARPFPWNGVLGACSALLFWLFFRHEAKSPTPIIPRDAWNIQRPLGVAFLGMALTTAAFGGAETFLPLILQGVWETSPLQAGWILTVGSLSWSFTSVYTARFADYPRHLSLLGALVILLGLVMLWMTVFFHGPLYAIYGGWFVVGLGMGQVIPTYNTLAIDAGSRYPSGVSTGALLLSLNWGFAVGAPIAGLAAQAGFGYDFSPSRIGLGALSTPTLTALRSGGSYVLIACLVLALLAMVTATRMPKTRIRS